MKTFTVVFVALLALSVAWGLGYRTGALDEGMRNRDRIETLERELADGDRAFAEAYGKFVACVSGDQ